MLQVLLLDEKNATNTIWKVDNDPRWSLYFHDQRVEDILFEWPEIEETFQHPLLIPILHTLRSLPPNARCEYDTIWFRSFPAMICYDMKIWDAAPISPPMIVFDVSILYALHVLGIHISLPKQCQFTFQEIDYLLRQQFRWVIFEPVQTLTKGEHYLVTGSYLPLSTSRTKYFTTFAVYKNLLMFHQTFPEQVKDAQKELHNIAILHRIRIQVPNMKSY
jgi:hypothetical protein